MAVLSPPLKVMITGDYLKTAIAIARWGLSDLDPQGSMVLYLRISWDLLHQIHVMVRN